VSGSTAAIEQSDERGAWWLSAVALVGAVLGYVAIAGAIYLGGQFDAAQGGRAGSLTALFVVLLSLIGGIAGLRGCSRTSGWSPSIRRYCGLTASALGPLVALGIVVFVFAAADAWQGGLGNFWSLGSLRLVAVQTVTIAVAALGMTMIIIAGGIDLSAGTALALSGTVCALMFKHEFGPLASLSAAIACGGACGALNGVLTSMLRLVPFIITLGTMTIFLGIGKSIAEDGGTITPPMHAVPEWLETMVTQSPASPWIAWPLLPNFAWGVWLACGLAVLVALILHRTLLGRYVYAIGSNEATARLCGIPVPQIKVLVYALAGCLVGIAGIYQFARLSKGDATSGMGLELKIIAAVVIGGGSLSGGRGSVVGTLCGATIMSVIGHGCTALGLENQVEDILLGMIIVAAVYVDHLRQQRLGT
jgi:ribose transport system permease protein